MARRRERVEKEMRKESAVKECINCRPFFIDSDKAINIHVHKTSCQLFRAL
jgi:hypothetical protein